MRETWVRFLGWEDPWRRAWQPTPVFLPGESPWTQEPGGFAKESMGSQRVRHDWPTKHSTYTWRRVVASVATIQARNIFGLCRSSWGGREFSEVRKEAEETTRLDQREEEGVGWAWKMTGTTQCHLGLVGQVMEPGIPESIRNPLEKSDVIHSYFRKVTLAAT